MVYKFLAKKSWDNNWLHRYAIFDFAISGFDTFDVGCNFLIKWGKCTIYTNKMAIKSEQGNVKENNDQQRIRII